MSGWCIDKLSRLRQCEGSEYRKFNGEQLGFVGVANLSSTVLLTLRLTTDMQHYEKPYT